MQKYKRKKLNLQVKRQFQLWLLVRVLITVLISSMVAAFILYLYARQEVTGSFYDAHIKIRRVSDLLLPVVLAGSFISLMSGALIALFLPQKIAGPLFRIEKGMKDIQDGDLQQVIHIRTADPLQGLVKNINSALDMLRSKIPPADLEKETVPTPSKGID